MALREMTDDSGGRTEIVRDPRDLDPAVASIADELSQQYYLGYPSPGLKDGRWHTIRVEVRDPALTGAGAEGIRRDAMILDLVDRTCWHALRSSEGHVAEGPL